jgi:hypothetical protein
VRSDDKARALLERHANWRSRSLELHSPEPRDMRYRFHPSEAGMEWMEYESRLDSYATGMVVKRRE